MNKNWDYADLSKSAKENGGPEAYVDFLVDTGREEGREEMIPWLGVAIGIGSLITLGVSKGFKCYKGWKEKRRQEQEIAKEKIIQGINAYDTQSESEE